MTDKATCMCDLDLIVLSCKLSVSVKVRVGLHHSVLSIRKYQSLCSVDKSSQFSATSDRVHCVLNFVY